jgi:hypothetical protein
VRGSARGGECAEQDGPGQRRSATQRWAKLPGSPGISTVPLGWCQVVSTRMPVRATIRINIVAKMASAARPNPEEDSGLLGAGALWAELVSGDTEVPELMLALTS